MAGSFAGGSWVMLNLPVLLATAQTACSRRDAGGLWLNLGADEAAGLAAVAEQIFPGGGAHGAAEAGVTHFIDAALGTFMAGALPLLQEGLADLDRQAVRAGGEGGRFTDLEFDEQTCLLEKNEETPFFQTMIFLTQAGLFAMPAYGGNRGSAGWRAIGFERRHAWQPPFGHYDAQRTSGTREK